MKAFRPGRCALCGKLPDHPIHRVEPPQHRRGPGLLYRLLHLGWPRWMHHTMVPPGKVGLHRHVRDSSAEFQELRLDLQRSRRAVQRLLRRAP